MSDDPSRQVSLPVAEHAELDATLKPHQVGTLYACPSETETWWFDGQLRTGLKTEERDSFVEWAKVAIQQLYATGDPEANGWFPSQIAPGCWYMTAAVHELPSLD